VNQPTEIPKISIKTSTYNHESFITQAIEGVLMQKVNFDYELIIGEDCSTDRTRQRVKDYQRQYPDKIRLFLPEGNMGRRHNFLQTLKACRGQYIALLDGDDYWTSPYKLQKQADYLDGHPECAICFHNVMVIHEDEHPPYPFHAKGLNPVLGMEDLLCNNFIPTCSTLFRNGLFVEFPSIFDNLPYSDWPLHVLNAMHGTIGYIDEVMGVYRIHGRGLWSQGGHPSAYTVIKHAKADICFYKKVNKFLAYRYNHLIQERIAIRRQNARQAVIDKITHGLINRFPQLYKIYRYLKYGAD
jgi:glycosyltransferase involved in cell wall biosynthesis